MFRFFSGADRVLCSELSAGCTKSARLMQVKRRASSTGSLRRSSVSSRDIEAIQRALQKQRSISNQLAALLILALPLASLFYAHLIFRHAGNVAKAISSLFRPPFVFTLIPPILDVVAWKCTIVALGVQLLFYWFLPHDVVTVLSTSIGDHKKAINGFSSFLLTLLLYPFGAAVRLYRPDVFFLHFHSIIGCLTCIAVFLMIVLYVSYRFGSGNTIDTPNEFLLGVDVYPTWAEVDLKHFLRTRVTLSFWALYVVSAAFHQVHLNGKLETSALCLCTLQVMYVFRALWNEDLLLNGLDSRRSKCGFYRILTDMAFFPILYCAPMSIVVQLNIRISMLGYVGLSSLCFICLLFGSSIDRQKYEFRLKKGNMKVSGNDPYFIQAKYRTETGEFASSLLLGSGYWGICRHPNYVTEVLIFFSFVMFQSLRVVYFYFPLIFMIFYLLTRTLNDENRCLIKYGTYWIQYCQRVPFRFLPGIF